jgi:orotate phosphoribosyltransferase
LTQVVDWSLLDRKNEERFVADLERAGVILEGHFVLRSGMHTHKFVDIKGLYPHTRIAKNFGRALALRIQRELGFQGVQQVAGVVAPVMGGVILAHDTADWLSFASQEFDREFLALFVEKDTLDKEKFFFGRGYDEYIPGRHWVVVEDVVTTGSAIRGLVEQVRGLGGYVDVACAIWDRGQVGEHGIDGVPLISLVSKGMPAFDVPHGADCPLCKKDEPINTKHGRGAEYLEKHGQIGNTA